MPGRKKVSSLTKSELVKEISKETNINAEVVDVVVEKFIDIVIEQIVNGQDFSIRGFFNVSHFMAKNVSSIVEMPEYSQRLRFKVSPNIKVLYRLQQDEFKDKPFFINRDNWRGALNWVLDNRKKTSESNKLEDVKEITEDKTINPFLDDDDE